MFLINPKEKTPIFAQLKRQILDYIALGVLKEDDQLPSVRALASQLGINPNTVSKAYQELELEGYLYTMAGKGVFINKSTLDEKVLEAKKESFKQCVQECLRYGIEKGELMQILVAEQEEVKGC